ncbi:hypothetical protein ACV6K4_000094 [Acinetobacter baumannii]|nr:hypothetical protein [Acinetobacter baumannii]EKU6362227.1 hypothetical protein [Acinetobacter baumannii]EKV5731291.1 hypothetical protein [Acinetobacter baumannii]EKW7561013.1 hypothetical protein [Acinetobacter baumannii]EKX2283763.1 hypothetical protein [Acinetobacter baumannii]
MEKYPYIILAHSRKGERFILSNSKGYLSAHWEYSPNHIQVLKQVWDLEKIKSSLLNQKASIDWDSYQWILNKFDELNQDHRSPADIFAQGLKEAFEEAASNIRRLVEAWSKFGYKVQK